MNYEVFSIPEAARQFPTCPSVATVWRWILNGVRGPGGDLVYLEAQRLGRRRFVTREAIDRFIAAFNEPRFLGAIARQEAAKEAGQALESLGC